MSLTKTMANFPIESISPTDFNKDKLSKSITAKTGIKKSKMPNRDACFEILKQDLDKFTVYDLIIACNSTSSNSTIKLFEWQFKNDNTDKEEEKIVIDKTNSNIEKEDLTQENEDTNTDIKESSTNCIKESDTKDSKILDKNDKQTTKPEPTTDDVVDLMKDLGVSDEKTDFIPKPTVEKPTSVPPGIIIKLSTTKTDFLNFIKHEYNRWIRLENISPENKCHFLKFCFSSVKNANKIEIISNLYSPNFEKCVEQICEIFPKPEANKLTKGQNFDKISSANCLPNQNGHVSKWLKLNENSQPKVQIKKGWTPLPKIDQKIDNAISLHDRSDEKDHNNTVDSIMNHVNEMKVEAQILKKKQVDLAFKTGQIEKKVSTSNNYPTIEQKLIADGKSVCVTNVDFSVTAEYISEIFSLIGKVARATIMMDKNMKSKGYAFIEFESIESVEKAVYQMNGTKLCNRIIKVSPKRTNSPKSKKFKNRNFGAKVDNNMVTLPAKMLDNMISKSQVVKGEIDLIDKENVV